MEDNRPLKTNEFRITVTLRATVTNDEVKEALMEQNILEEALKEIGKCDNIIIDEVYFERWQK